MPQTLVELEDGWLAKCPGVLGEDEPSLLYLHEVEDERCKKSDEVGNEAGARILCDAGNVAELYDELSDGIIDGERSSDGDFGANIVRAFGDDSRKHRKRLSQSLSKPCDTLISCSFRIRNDGRTSGLCAQHFFIT